MLCHNAYAQYPVCNPSRASFLAGKRPDEIGIVSNTLPFRKALPDLVSLPQLFRQNGYFTAGTGKIFHLAEPRNGKPVLFEDSLSWEYFYDGMRDATEAGRKGVGLNLTNGKIPWCTWRAAEGGDDDQPDGLNAAAAIRILEEHHDKPFFMGLGFHKPHDPFIAPKKYFDLYPVEKTKPPHELTGTSLRSVMENPKLPGKKAAYTQVNRGKAVGRSVRTARWRYTEWGPEGKDGMELYDHSKDPGEYHNLSANPKAANTIKELAKLLKPGFPKK